MAENNKAVWAALASNAAIMISKFIGAAAGGSSSLLAEALHSVADTGDSAMLLFGKRRGAKRPPDDEHPFGHGKELYFWTLVVAVSIFTIGGVASIIEGIERIIKPGELEDPTWTYVVLGLGFVFEGTSMVIAWRQFMREKGKDRGIWEGIKKAKDPTTFMVVFEDTAAVIGVAIAFIAVFLAHHFKLPWVDGAGALCVGVLMAGVATFLIYEIHALLVGERIVPGQLKQIEQVFQADPDVERIDKPLTMHLGPDVVLLTVRTKFKTDLDSPAITSAIQRLHAQLCEADKTFRYIFIEPIAADAD